MRPCPSRLSALTVTTALLGAVLLGFAAPGPVRPSQAASLGASDPSILIGAIASLSGSNALAGQDMIDGFNLALKQLNGRFSNQEVRLIVSDDKGLPDLALIQTRKMLERERLDVVLTATSASAMAQILRPLNKSRLFVLSLDQPAPTMAGRDCGPWMFSLAPHPDGQHEALALHLNQEKKLRLYVIAPDTPLGEDMIAAIRRIYHGEVIVAPFPKAGSMTYQPQLDELERVQPDAVYSLLTGGMGVSFIRAWATHKEQRGTLPLFVRWEALERQTLPALGDAALDVLSIGSWSPDLDTPITKKFDTEFESEYGRLPTSWAAQGYDAAMLLDSALKPYQGRTHDAEGIRNALRRAEFTSTRGAFKFNLNQFPMVNYVLRRVVRDSKGRLTFESKSTVLREWRDRYSMACATRWAEDAATAASVPPVSPAAAVGGNSASPSPRPAKPTAAGITTGPSPQTAVPAAPAAPAAPSAATQHTGE